MRDYGIVSPRFWIGETGKALRGDANAQVLAIYLMTSPHATMTGVFHCPVLYMSHETGLPLEGASKALARLSEEGFCQYDEASETVFVVNMARHQIGESLKVGDNRIAWLRKELDKLIPRYKKLFLHLYGDAYKLEYSSPSEGPSKPLRSQDQDQDQDQKQEQDLGMPAEAGRNEVSESEPESKPRGHSRATQFPEDFRLDEELTAYATARLPGVQVSELFENFRNHHTARGTTMKRWDAAWRTWVGNAPKLGYPGQPDRRYQSQPPKRSREFQG